MASMQRFWKPAWFCRSSVDNDKRMPLSMSRNQMGGSVLYLLKDESLGVPDVWPTPYLRMRHMPALQLGRSGGLLHVY